MRKIKVFLLKRISRNFIDGDKSVFEKDFEDFAYDIYFGFNGENFFLCYTSFSFD
jgi:hypothetical protein